jgi:hypothetical protein
MGERATASNTPRASYARGVMPVRGVPPSTPGHVCAAPLDVNLRLPVHRVPSPLPSVCVQGCHGGQTFVARCARTLRVTCGTSLLGSNQ